MFVSSTFIRCLTHLRVSPQRDVIEVPISGDLDINGWELRKALGLLKRATPP
jgi:predicted nucleotidyltransferase